jgi:hypothetical protein
MLKNYSFFSIRSFISYFKHNKKIFKNTHKNSSTEILLEYNALCDSHIVYSYLSNYLSNKYKAQIISYDVKFNENFLRNFLQFIKKYFFFSYHSIYKSFGVKSHVTPKRLNLKKNKIEINKIYKGLKKKDDIFKIKIKNINFGDLLYDGFLRKYNFSTIDIKSNVFKEYLFEFINLSYFWFNYFDKKNVKAVILSHTVYEFGIPLRIAIHKKCKVYSAASYFIFSHSAKNQTIQSMKYYAKDFKKFSYSEKKIFISMAEKLLNSKFAGKKTIENKISLLPPDKLFHKKKNKKNVLNNNKKKKVLIAAHHFSDAPNCYGKFLFNDFYDWVDFLGKKSINSKYDWYIKFHPMEFEENNKTINYFQKKYKNINLIEKNVAHSDLINSGIDLVLTVYGTIGLEYAYFKIPVINATQLDPHCAYNFNYHAKTISDYNFAIDNFDKLKINYNKKKIYEYFFMRYLNSFYLFDDEIKNNNLSINYQSPDVYDKWLSNFEKKNNKYLKEKIHKFVESDKFRCEKYS